MSIPVGAKGLPLQQQIWYEPEKQCFQHTYENGDLSVHGNNLSVYETPIEDVVFYLVQQVSSLNIKINKLEEMLAKMEQS